MRNKNIILVLALICLLALWSLASAQQVSQGTIRGIVEDETGARLPGVTVTVTGTALVEAERVFITEQSGIFRFPALTPGVYTITLELQGFNTIKREGIIVSPKKTVSLNFTMKIATVEEVITVTAESPTVDTKTTTSKQDYTAEFLNDIPERRGTGSDVMNLAPTGTSYSFAGGGVSSISWQMDGVDVSDPDMSTQWTFFSVDAMQETEVITWGAMPEFGKFSGAIFNVVTKSGTTEFHGEGNFFYRNKSFFGENTEKVQEQYPDFSITPFELKKYYDFSFNIGGPLIKNKLHFFSNFYQLYNDRIPSGNVEVATDHSRRWLTKLSFIFGKKDRFSFSYYYDGYPVTGRVWPDGTKDPNAYCEEPSWGWNMQPVWQHVFSQRAMLEVRYMHFWGFYDLVPRNNLPAIYDLATGDLSQSYWYYMHNGRGNRELHVDYSYFADQWAGTHDFKVGVHYQDAYTHTKVRYGQNEFGDYVYYWAWEGVIYYSIQRQPTDLTHYYRPLTFYAQDSWVIGDRFTINGGVRIDKTSGGKRGGTEWVNYTDIAPRIGASYELTKDGKTVVRASFGRYFESPHTGTYAFKDESPTYYGYVLAPGVFDVYEVWDPSSTANIDPNLKNHYADMFSFGIERELFPDLSVSVQYNHREDKRIFGGEDRVAQWAPFSAVDPVTGNTITLYYQTNLGENDRWLINNDKLHMKYDGVDIIVRKRFRNNWQLMANLTIQRSKGNYDLGYGPGGYAPYAIELANDPNDFINAEGNALGTNPIIFKLQGSYRFPKPFDFLIGWTYEYLAGEYDTRTWAVQAPNWTRYTILAEPRGSYQNESRSILDLRLEKKIKLPGSIGGMKDAGELGIILDIFNVFNEDTITSRRMQTGSLYLYPRSLVTPRGLRLGVRWLF
jgi:hypothetical protein